MAKETEQLQLNTIYDETPHFELIVVTRSKKKRETEKKQHWPIDFGSMFTVQCSTCSSLHTFWFGSQWLLATSLNIASVLFDDVIYSSSTSRFRLTSYKFHFIFFSFIDIFFLLDFNQPHLGWCVSIDDLSRLNIVSDQLIYYNSIIQLIYHLSWCLSTKRTYEHTKIRRSVRMLDKNKWQLFIAWWFMVLI